MEIVHLILGRANPNRMNGVNRVVHNLATAQASVGEIVSVWGITDSFDKEDDLDRSYLTNWFASKGRFIVCKDLKEAIRISSPGTIFHLHGGFLSIYYTLSLLLVKANRTFVITPHGTYTAGAMEGNGWIKKLYFSWFEKRMLSRAKVVQCLGHSEESDLRVLCSEVNIKLIPNGQNMEELKVTAPIPVSDQFIIGYCGRISKWHKGLDVLIESYSHYKQYFKGKGVLHLIGDGEYLLEMKKIAKKNNIEQDVVFFGRQFGEDKVRKIMDMKVFVHTSRNEGLPTAVIEAASLSIPCLVTEMTSMDRYVSKYNAGWVAESLDIEHIARLFLDAEQEYFDDKLEVKKHNVFKMVKENFDWQKIAYQTIDMYGA